MRALLFNRRCRMTMPVIKAAYWATTSRCFRSRSSFHCRWDPQKLAHRCTARPSLCSSASTRSTPQQPTCGDSAARFTKCSQHKILFLPISSKFNTPIICCYSPTELNERIKQGRFEEGKAFQILSGRTQQLIRGLLATTPSARTNLQQIESLLLWFSSILN